MTFAVNRSALSDALRYVSTVAPRRDLIPILSSILVTPTASALALTANNLEQQATSEIVALGTLPEAAFCVDRARLAAAVDSLADGEIEMALVDGHLTMKARNGGRRKIPTVVGEFPHIEVKGESGGRLEIDGAMLRQALEMTRTAVATEISLAQCMGVHICAADKSLRFVATDGKRLNVWERDYSGDGFGPLTVPTAALGGILSLFADDDVVHLESFDGRLLRVTAGRRQIVTKLIEASFPPYERVLPEVGPMRLSGSAEELVRAIGAAAAMADDDHRLVRLTAGDGGVTASVQRDAEAFEPVDVEANAEFVAAFNSKFAREALKSFGERMVDWTMDDPGGARPPATLIRSEGHPLTVALMPARP